MENSEKIRHLNDRLRKGDISVPGKIIFTSGLVQLLQENEKQPTEIISIVIAYDDFTNDNDPYGEHDFGVFKFCNETLFWKIDYYDQDIQYGSNDPSNIEETFRMLTVLLASEY